MSDNYDPLQGSAEPDSSADLEDSATSESSAEPKSSTEPDDAAGLEKSATSHGPSLSNEDAVGYKQPPKEHQFKKGCSGNPKGRPKRKKALFDRLEADLNELITVKEGEKRKRVSKLEAMIKSLSAKALSGDLRALTKILDLHNQLAPPEKKFGAEGHVLVKKSDARAKLLNRLNRIAEAARADDREKAEARQEGAQDNDSDTDAPKDES